MKYTIILLIATCTFFDSRAQKDLSFQNLIDVVTTSPEAASLGKFGNIPVGNFTGVAAVNIPIYEINVGKMKFPISLSYHAGGIRVDETSSSVGIGWALNAVGIITRNMVGKPDEIGSTYNYIGSPDAQAVFDSPASHYTYLWDLKNKVSDNQPDVYQFNVNGLSGKFIFRNNGTIMQIPVSNNKIAYASGNFTIKDAEGNVYIFNEKRQTYSSETSSPTYVSTWCLTKMISANSVDEITFNYESQVISSYDKIESFTRTLGNIPACSGGGALQEASHISNVTHQEYYIKEIKWRGGKILFTNINDRNDVSTGALRLDGIEVYSYQNGIYSLVKKTKLYQSYFYSNPGGTVTEKNYRLKLDAVSNLDKYTNAPIETYSMTYNSTPIAPRGSYAQDRWGFNNGHYENSNLMMKQTALYQSMYYAFGGANRDANESEMLACTLSSIKYPTKGKTVFEFEPHKFHTNITPTQYKSLYSSICCGNSSYSQQSFTVNSISSNFRYRAFISKFNYPDVTDRPRIKVTDQTTGQLVIQESITDDATDTDYYSSGSGSMRELFLTQGHTYLIEFNIYTTNPNVSAWIEIGWDETLPGASDIKLGGGLRIKSATNYGVNGEFLGKDTYQYGSDGTGTILTPQYYQDINYEHAHYSLQCSGSPQTAGGAVRIYHSNSVLPASQYSGSPVVYKIVTKQRVDANENPMGKEVFTYGVYQDQSSEPPVLPNVYFSIPSFVVIYYISNEWKNGSLLSEETYKSVSGGYQLVRRRTNTYNEGLASSSLVLKVHINFTHNFRLEAPNADDPLLLKYIGDNFTLNLLPVNTGAMLLDSSTETSYDDNGNAVVNVQSYTYGSTPLLPSKIETSSSTDDVVIQHMKYPLDLSSTGNVYEKMVDRNIISPVVQAQTMRNGNQLTLTKINYNDWFGNSKLLLPHSVIEQVGTNPEEVRVQFNSFDAYGNILQQRNANDVYQTYLWGYNQSLSIAQITNATLSQSEENGSETKFGPTVQVPGLQETYTTFQSGITIEFEQDVTLEATVTKGSPNSQVPDHYYNVPISLYDAATNTRLGGSFGLGTSSVNINDVPPGNYVLQYNYLGNIGDENSFTFSTILTYQIKKRYSTIFHTSFEEDTQNVSAESYTGRQSHAGAYTVYLPKETGEYILSYWTKQGTEKWQYQEEPINVTSSTSQSRTIGTGKLLDEVRLYPRNAQMTTYTYDPLVGTTSVTDTNNVTTYYEYDTFGRLEIVRDSDQNIVKHYKYNYKTSSE